ncbi:hypothetical protein HHK36_017230 [Tetracentron sinense]|uniref:Leucine-rich repeat-containing N-terminal plant-type domain-containing protein n=1 Tax=Tetracentron sinense TaxID=13715 RepID=A0A834Z4V1_TETSI|nr:hypothetical protein HHK36_017230 [Tetracentron sinense]
MLSQQHSTPLETPIVVQNLEVVEIDPSPKDLTVDVMAEDSCNSPSLPNRNTCSTTSSQTVSLPGILGPAPFPDRNSIPLQSSSQQLVANPLQITYSNNSLRSSISRPSPSQSDSIHSDQATTEHQNLGASQPQFDSMQSDQATTEHHISRASQPQSDSITDSAPKEHTNNSKTNLHIPTDYAAAPAINLEIDVNAKPTPSSASTATQHDIPSNSHPMLTRSKDGTLPGAPKTFSATRHQIPLALLTTTSQIHTAPSSLKASLEDPLLYLNSSWNFSDNSEGSICKFTGVECWHPDENRVMNI